MARGISAAARAAAALGVVRPAAFIEVEFDSGSWRTWAGIGDLVVGGAVYIGTGVMLSLELPSETADLTASPIRVRISGLDAEMLALALAEPYQGRVMTIRIGFFNEDNQLVGMPDIWMRARLDVMSVEEGGETSTIDCLAETKLRDLRRPIGFLYTTEDQETAFPGDQFFEFVPTIGDKQQYWGDRIIDR